MGRKKKVKIGLGIVIGSFIFVLVLIASATFLFMTPTVQQTFLPNIESCVEDRSCCDSRYDIACIRTDVDKSIPYPVNIIDLSTEEHANINTKGAGWLHYPGSMYKIDMDSVKNYKGGLGRLHFVSYGTISSSFARVDCGSTKDYQWRPNKITKICDTWGGTIVNQDQGGRRTEIETYTIDENSFIIHVGATCLQDKTCVVGLNHEFSEGTVSQEMINGHSVIKRTYTLNGRKISDYSGEFYFLADVEPTYKESGQFGWLVQPGEVFETYIIVADKTSKEYMFDMVDNPKKYIKKSNDFFNERYRNYEYPSEVESDWGRERYYRAQFNFDYNLFHADQFNDAFWKDYYVISPGAEYDGGWIWDSFFAAWAKIASCIQKDCVQPYFDTLRMLIANKYPSGQWAREVWYNFKGEGWQAPGGWSFAVDQADRKWGGHEFSTEFYDELVKYHNWVRTTDSDGDNIFEWRGTNSGWDGSIRWNYASEAVDLQSWMVMDAESLLSIAKRIGRTEDIIMWEQRLADYRAALQTMCDTDFCYDQETNSNTPSPVMSAAGLMPLMTGSLSKEQAKLFAQQLYNPDTLGPIDLETGAGILPTTSREFSLYYPCGEKTWSGAQWFNIFTQVWLGLNRYGLDKEADYLRKGAFYTLYQGGIGYESYCSDNLGSALVGNRVTGSFKGDTYTWTDGTVIQMSIPFRFSYEPIQPGEPICIIDKVCTYSDPVNECGTYTCHDNNDCVEDTVEHIKCEIIDPLDPPEKEGVNQRILIAGSAAVTVGTVIFFIFRKSLGLP